MTYGDNIEFSSGPGFAPTDREDNPRRIVRRVRAFAEAIADHPALPPHCTEWGIAPAYREGGRMRFTCVPCFLDGSPECVCLDWEERIDQFIWAVGLDPQLAAIAREHQLVVRGPCMAVPRSEQ